MKWLETARFSCDWLNIVVDLPRVDDTLRWLSNILGVSYDDWKPNDKGLHFYKYSFRLNATAGGVTLGGNAIIASFTPLTDTLSFDVATSYSPYHPQHGILLSFSGDGLRWVRSVCKKEKELYEWLCSVPHHCTRIDMALDIIEPDNILIPLFQQFANNAYNPQRGDIGLTGLQRSSNYVTINPVFDPVVNDYTNNVSIGDRTSTKGHCVVYNKRVEVATSRRLSDFAKIYFDSIGCTSTDYWWRVEYRGKGDLADRVFHNLCYEGDISAFLELVNSLFKFFIVRYLDNHFSNGDECEDWTIFIDWLTIHKTINFVEYFRSSVPYVSSSLERQNRYSERNSATLAYNDWLRRIRPSEYDERRRYGESVLLSRGISFEDVLRYLDSEYDVEAMFDVFY